MGWHPPHDEQITWAGENVNNAAYSSELVGVMVERIDGLLERPPMRVTNRLRPGRHGARRGKRKQAPRPFTMSGIVWGSSLADVEARKDALAEVFTPDERDEDGALLEFVHPVHGAQQITARVEQEFVWGDPFERGNTWPHVGMNWLVGMVAHDPRRYDADLTSVETTDIATSGGMSFPVVFPLSFDSGASGGTVTVPAGGSFERPATLKIYGPVTNPVIEEVGGDSGLAVAFDGLAISSGDWVEIDTDSHSVRLYYGSASGYLNVYTYLDPDETLIRNLPKDAITLRLRGSVITDPAYLQVQTRDAYI
jgi:hypothetical protein